jgi:hypothetical protein
VKWQDLEVAAPEIVELGRQSIDRAGVALLGTSRKNGFPRISPVEPYFTEGHLLFGAMAWSSKVRDLRRDQRCVLHSAVSGANTGEGEFKLYGRAAEADQQLRNGCDKGWWIGRPPEIAYVFFLNIEEAAFVNWDYQHEEMVLKRWSTERGFQTIRRTYP